MTNPTDDKAQGYITRAWLILTQYDNAPSADSLVSLAKWLRSMDAKESDDPTS